MDGEQITLASISTLLIAVGRVYRGYVLNETLRKYTPLAIFAVCAVLVVGINYGWNNGLNVWQMGVYTIVYTINAMLGYMTAKDQTAEELRNSTASSNV